jgi:hypothetical protein
MPVALLHLLALFAAAGPAAAPGAPAAPAPIVQVMNEQERIALQQTDEVRLGLPTQSAVDAWRNPGLRVQLGYGYGIVRGVGPAFSFRSQTALLRPSVRLDRYWALGIGLLYGTGPNGLRWGGTLEPTFYPWRDLAVTVGAGYGGLLVSDPNASSGTLQGTPVTVSRDLVAGERLTSCEGAALTALARVEYLFVVGPLFATGPFAQANGQWTHCQNTLGDTDPETGRPIVLTQWWTQRSATFGWWLAWR